MLSQGFKFSSPIDIRLNRAEHFERYRRGTGQRQQFEFVRLVETGDEIIVTYEMTRGDVGKGRNTETLTLNEASAARKQLHHAAAAAAPADPTQYLRLASFRCLLSVAERPV